MNYSVDVSYEYKLARSKFLRVSLFYSLLLTIVIVADVILVSIPTEEYLPFYIIATIVTSLFACFSIYFFTNIYGDINSRYRYFKGYDSGLKPTEEVEFLKKSDELCYINGLYAYPVFVRYFIGINCQDKVIFCLKNDLQYEMGDKLTIVTYQRILMKAEKHL